MWSILKRTWNLYKNLRAGRDLLRALGAGKVLGLVLATTISCSLTIWAAIKGLPGPLLALVFLAAFLLVTVISLVCVLIWKAARMSETQPTMAGFSATITHTLVKGNKPQEPSVEPSVDLRSEIELRRAKRNDGILLFLENTTNRTLKGCGLTVAMLSRFYEEMNDFIRPYEFTSVNLLEPQDLSPKQRSSEAYLVHHKHHFDSAPTLGDQTGNSPRAVPEPGAWRAHLHIFSAGGRAYSEDVFFQWEPGARVDFTPNPMLAIHSEITKEKSQSADRKTLKEFRKLLPNEGAIQQLRNQQFFSRFPWDAAADAVLSSFLQDAGPDHGFLDEQLEELRRQLHEAINLLLDRVRRYSDPLSEISDGSSGAFRMFWKLDNEDIAAYDARRNEVFEAANRVCALYDGLVLTARRKVEG
jgi:hypothetical protein